MNNDKKTVKEVDEALKEFGEAAKPMQLEVIEHERDLAVQAAVELTGDLDEANNLIAELKERNKRILEVIKKTDDYNTKLVEDNTTLTGTVVEQASQLVKGNKLEVVIKDQGTKEFLYKLAYTMGRVAEVNGTYHPRNIKEMLRELNI